MKNNPVLIGLDTEIIGPNFLVCTHTVSSGKTRFFWNEDREEFKKLYANPNVTFVTFNGLSFDAPLVQAFVNGQSGEQLKDIANAIVDENLLQWQTTKRFNIGPVKADFIDIKEVAPGVMLSLKTYEGRMHYPHLQDMPIDHRQLTLTERERALVAKYCQNDVTATLALYKTIEQEVTLREQMGEVYGLDLRSKSGAQVAKAILCKVCEIPRNDNPPPKSVRYSVPSFIDRSISLIDALVTQIEAHEFEINPANGSPKFPEFLREPIRIGEGIYQMGVGGLHSVHDTKIHYVSDAAVTIKTSDASSFYPNLTVKAGITPKLQGGRGDLFLATYSQMLSDRMEAKNKVGEIQKKIKKLQSELSKCG